MSIFEMMGYAYVGVAIFAAFCFMGMAMRWDGNHSKYLSYHLSVSLTLQPWYVFLRLISLLSLGWPVVLAFVLWVKIRT